MKIVYKTGQNFKVLLETEKNGVHFALLENLGEKWLHNNNNNSLNLFLKYAKEFDALGRKGGYYLFWGPIDDEPHYQCHGISPLRDHYKWRLSRVVKEFFKIVENSEKQSFIFTNNH